VPPRKTILILTSGPLCRNPRVLKEAHTLGNASYDVTVVTVANDDRFEAIDRELLTDVPFRKIAVDLRSFDFISRSRQFAQRIKTWLARHAARHGIESAEAFGPYGALLKMARTHVADLTIAHTEVALCVACVLAREGRRVAADFEDWHSEDLLPTSQATRPRRLLREAELDLLRNAIYTTTTSGCLAAALQAASGGPSPVVITNSFPLQSAPNSRNLRAPPPLFWFSQTIGPGRGLEPFLDAWSRTRAPSRIRLLGDVDPCYRASLIDRVAAHRRSDIDFLPLTSPWELPSVIAAHDVGLALEALSPPSRNLTITNKLLQYLNAGLAVIATRTDGQNEALSRCPGAAIAVDLERPAELATQLDLLLSDRTRLSSMAQAARAAAEAVYNWEAEAPRLLATVDAALQTAPRSVVT